MAIRASLSQQIEPLLRDLGGGSAVAREAAIARLTVIGARAVARLVDLAASNASSAARVGALRALEGIGEPRALDAALKASDDADADVACAAIALARTFVRGDRSALVVDRLTAIALDTRRPSAVRAAAVRALRDLAPATVAPLLRSLSGDADAAVRAEAAPPRGRKRSETKTETKTDPLAIVTAAGDGALGDDPARLRTAIADAGDRAPLPLLLQIVEHVRARERTEPARTRADWTTLRAAAHLALARRGSRIALYDLRESLAQAKTPLPVDTLTALSLAGDAACLDPIASAYSQSAKGWWQDHLRDAFRAIVTRERLTRRHAEVRKAQRRHNQAFGELWPK